VFNASSLQRFLVPNSGRSISIKVTMFSYCSFRVEQKKERQRHSSGARRSLFGQEEANCLHQHRQIAFKKYFQLIGEKVIG
jgi:hypothetical protein